MPPTLGLSMADPRDDDLEAEMMDIINAGTEHCADVDNDQQEDDGRQYLNLDHEDNSGEEPGTYPSSTCSNGAPVSGKQHMYGTVLDSGTTYAYLPEQAFVAFRDAVTSKVHSLKKIRGPDPNYKDICFAGAGRNVLKLHEVFPDVDMVFGNGQKLSLTPENYLFRHSKVDGAYCLGVFQNGKDPTTLLGG
ncbi:uncharacterized protein [Miscanthus floridulus]